MRRLLISGLALAALVATADRAEPQAVAKQFQVVPAAGWTTHDNASALDAAPFLGVDASYFLTRNLAFGLQFYAARPVTKGEDLPLALMDFGDTTFIYAVSQHVTTVGAGVQLQYHIPFNQIEAFALGGAGVYQIYLDPRRTQDVSRHSGPTVTLGGGLSYAVSEAVGVRIEARDMIWMDYDRSVLDATERTPYVRNNRFPDLIAAPPEAKDVVHNFRFALGFSFIPGQSR